MAAGSMVSEQIVMDAATRLLSAPHGERTQIVRDAAARAGLSVQTVYRRVQKLTGHMQAGTTATGELGPRRKRRADAGATALAKEEAERIAAYLLETRRANGKQLADVESAVATLRANGAILAARIDEATGEVLPLSVTAINAALKQYRCHPGQLTQPAPKVAIATEHPNQCWQIDPSLCVLFYLRGEQGLRSMPRDEFYKNKPRNLARIENERAWRYVIVDHASGALYVEYVLGAESGQNLCDCFINATQARGDADPFHGVPLVAMVDPGSANTGAMFQNLCAALGVRVWINQPGQPWAKGSVEKHNDLVERKFEHRLKFHAVHSLAELNAAAWRWMREFNATAIHSRTGVSRFAAWMTISREQLRIAPAADLCRRLATAAPVERVVNSQLRVSWRGKSYDVSGVPGVIVGQKLSLAHNAWADADSAHVLGFDEADRPTHFVVPVLQVGRYGFLSDAVPFGEYQAHADTPADTNRKAIERLAMDAATDAEAAEKRKAKALPFGGRLDPYKTDAPKPEVAFLPRAGTPLQVDVPAVVTQPRTDVSSLIPQRLDVVHLSAIEAAVRVRAIVVNSGGAWEPEFVARIQSRYGEQVPEDRLGEIAQWLVTTPANVRAIGGGAA